ncbi:hypothetical protein DXG03_002333, partial [Asterophora parasitica]
GYWDLLEDDVDLKELEESEGKAMKKKMAEARVSMILRVEDLQLTHMTSQNPKVVWDTLAKVHHACSFGSCLQLRCKFITAHMSDGQSMEA